MHTLVAEGWYLSEDDIVVEALRRLLDTRRPQLMERFVREDVEWGLHGKD
jgi:Arc/MetJ-type ribon-helix-helix transcriptional regulator